MASMLRDVERGGPTEADHILGDLVARAQAKGIHAPLLRLAYSHLQAYATRQAAAN
jgi:2-dehydropantoate 2-reductase